MNHLHNLLHFALLVDIGPDQPQRRDKWASASEFGWARIDPSCRHRRLPKSATPSLPFHPNRALGRA
jgi:hypothetical protein